MTKDSSVASGPDAARISTPANTCGTEKGGHLRLVSDRDEINPLPFNTREWSRRALDILAAERERWPITPLIRIPAPEFPGIHLLLKDESQLPSGSLKHRLVHALFVEGIASGAIGPDTSVVEGSSGSTAISAAWFARRLGLHFLAVVPVSTAPAKLAAIRAERGDIMRVAEGIDLEVRAAEVAADVGGYHLDQFARAANASDWRGNDNIAAELFAQLAALGLGAPAWIVTGAGTGGTAATIGRYLRYAPEAATSRLCVVDPEGSAYFRAFVSDGSAPTGVRAPVVEGIGRGRVGPAFLPGVIDHMVAVSDEGSVSGAHWLARRSGRRLGPSTGTNVIGALILAQAMRRRGETGTIVLLGCDDGRRYNETIFTPDWCARHGVGPGGWEALLRHIGEANFPPAY